MIYLDIDNSAEGEAVIAQVLLAAGSNVIMVRGSGLQRCCRWL